MKNILIILLISFTSLSMAKYVAVILNSGDMTFKNLEPSDNSVTGEIPTKQKFKIMASDGISGDQFGNSVSMSGDVAIIGSYRDDNSKGAAYVFKYNGSDWVQVAKLTASDGSSGDRFGSSIAMDADTAIIGAYADDSSKGAAYVFKYNGSDWVQVAKLTASDGSSNDMFGVSIAMDADTAIIGAYVDDSWKGAAYVYKNTGTEWAQVTKLMASDGISRDQFGYSIAMNADTAIIGALGDDDRGAAYVFKYNGSDWAQVTKLMASDGSSNDRFGVSIAMDADTAIIGALGDDDIGAAYVYKNTGTEWAQVTKLTASDGSSVNSFGSSIAMDADTAIIGAYADDSWKGAAYVYKNTGTEWEQVTKLTASDGSSIDRFGFSVAMSTETAIIGSEGDDSNKGSAYIFVPE
ncbi:FG-GAP repeat protein [Vibrio parahaemolyticus]|nr:FG-GAP repeat protein [Vibrio parahaemolyticus]